MNVPSDVRPTAVPAVAPWLVLVVAVSAMSWAGPLVRLSTAPALAIAAWRLLFSSAFIALVLAGRRRALAGVRLPPADRRLAAAAGILLAAHFWSWIASLDWTTVASSVVLVSTQPIFVAAFSATFLGERPTVRQWLGITAAVAGAILIGWGDFGVSGRALVGDLLAVAAAIMVAGYYVIGRRLRQYLDIWVYIGIVYGIAAVILAAAALAHPRVTLTGYPPADWLIFVALAAGPMMLGHTGVNYSLRYLRAYVVNITLLGEAIGATVIAWLLPAIAERPPAQTLAGGALILAGIALAVLAPGGRRAAP
ncbi:MAG: DMT family transporter [Gemmatimonadetes bacterium]|nr:DMT family transporter [Gemmatimonadota bacterium]